MQVRWFLKALALTGFFAFILMTTPQAARSLESELPEELYREIMASCITSMSKNVVSNPVAKAYCYCYTERLGKIMTPADFERMDHYGINTYDKDRFKAASRHCKPKQGLF